jgi:hypothetical protein
MKARMHWWMAILFLFVLGWDFATWGAAARIPDIGAKLQRSAQREAVLATIYMSAGSIMDAALPPLESWGSQYVETALSEGFPRIKEDPTVAIDLIFSQTWNAKHAIFKILYWAAPVLAVLTLIFWARRPKKISLMGSRR